MDTNFLSSSGYTQGEMTWLFHFIPVYGILAVVGFGLTAVWAYIEWNKAGYRNWDFVLIISFSVILGLYGAKLWYIVFDFDHTFGPNGIHDLFSLLYSIFIPSSGRTIIGTIIFASIGIYFYPKWFSPDVNRYKAMDILLPAIAIGHAISRWGNFANHNVYGQIVDLNEIDWLPMWLTNNMLINGEYREPLFLYESFADIGTFAAIFFIFKTNKYWKDGVAGASYIMLYGLIRAIMEPFRDQLFVMSTFGIPTSFVTAIILFVIGFLLMIHFQRKYIIDYPILNTDWVV